ncbi:Eukaryotic translation initiation factor 5 [Chryseobacterium sp. JV274]|nr:Eukaryotic translation initiation factor 5 [Chryseobacterium sp. JV274]
MSHSYLKKSQNTYDSGDVLRSNNMFNSSIHCYYYTCMQAMNHVFHIKENLTDSQIRDLSKTSESHNNAINRLVKIIGLSSRNALTVDLMKLKEKRQLADYREFLLDDDDSIESKGLCDNVMVQLNKIL